MACNESLDFQQAISHVLWRLATPSMVLKLEQRAVSKLSAIRLHFAHMRFGIIILKLLSSLNVISNTGLSLLLVFSG